MTEIVGWLIVILGVVLAVLGAIATSRKSIWSSVAVLAVAAFIIGLQTWQMIKSYREEQAVRQRITDNIQFLVSEAEFAAALEYKMRGDPRRETPLIVAEYVTEIERWRTRTGNSLKERFPTTGADRLFLSALGDVSPQSNVPPVSRKMYYEYTRLRHCQTALFAILGSVDAFVRREQLVGQRAQAKAGFTMEMWALPSSEVWLAIFTAVLVVVSVLQWLTLTATHESNKVVERAYVGLSPESLQWSSGPSPPANISMEIRNRGRTPAGVTATSFEALVTSGPLPAIPSYTTQRQPVTAFLMAGDKFFDHRSFHIAPAQFTQLQAGAAALCIIGYVDYQDQFGREYRHGFARQYGSLTASPVFVTDAGYNYDHPV